MICNTFVSVIVYNEINQLNYGEVKYMSELKELDLLELDDVSGGGHFLNGLGSTVLNEIKEKICDLASIETGMLTVYYGYLVLFASTETALIFALQNEITLRGYVITEDGLCVAGSVTVVFTFQARIPKQWCTLL